MPTCGGLWLQAQGCCLSEQLWVMGPPRGYSVLQLTQCPCILTAAGVWGCDCHHAWVNIGQMMTSVVNGSALISLCPHSPVHPRTFPVGSSGILARGKLPRGPVSVSGLESWEHLVPWPCDRRGLAWAGRMGRPVSRPPLPQTDFSASVLPTWATPLALVHVTLCNPSPSAQRLCGFHPTRAFSTWEPPTPGAGAAAS